MSRRRVVVTGLGCISPVGNTVEDAWANLLAGRSGIDLITRFDATNFACKIAGEVKGFNVESYMSAKEARTMDTFIHFGVAAAHQAVIDSGLPLGDALDEETANRIGCIIGSGTVSNYDRSRGSSCLAERRMLEIIESGQATTPFLRFGDTVSIAMQDRNGMSLFGTILQRVTQGGASQTS